MASAGGEEARLASGVGGLLTAMCRELTDAPGARGCVASRVIGDVLVEVAEYTSEPRRLQLGHGYLVSDYPETAAVLASQAPRTLTLADPDVDAGEAEILRELGFDSVLMLPLVTRDGVWALVELYRRDDAPFSPDDVDTAVTSVAGFASLLQELLG